LSITYQKNILARSFLKCIGKLKSSQKRYQMIIRKT
jgi:hypothetical protein